MANRAITVLEGGTALISRGAGIGPAELYVASLGTETSRRTAKETLRRLTRILTGRLGEDDWRSVPWENLTARETTLLRTALLEQNAPSTVKLSLSVLRGVLKQAFRLGMMSAEIYQRAIMLDPVRAESAPFGRMLSPDEIRALAAHLARLPSPRGPMLRALFAIALGAGLRREELATLSVGAVALDNRHLRVMGKGRRERIQPIAAWVGEAARRWRELRGQLGLTAPTFFVHVVRKSLIDAPMNVEQMWALVVSTGLDAGCQRFSTHDLRRTFASRLLDSSDMATAQKLMAHKNPETTVRYDRRSDKTAADAAGALEGFGFELEPLEEKDTVKREFIPDPPSSGLGTLGDRARIRPTKISKAAPVADADEIERGASSPPGPRGKRGEDADREVKKPAESGPVLVESGQTLVKRRVAPPVAYRRNGSPLDMVWAKDVARKLTKKGHASANIAKGLGETRGVTRGDGTPIDAGDVERWLR